MDGVTILNTFVCENTDFYGLIFVCILMIVIGIFWLVYFIEEKDIFTLFLSCLFIISGILIMTDINDADSIKETRYQVTVDDSVNMNDFLSRYEIIDVEGKIYTVKEIDEEP